MSLKAVFYMRTYNTPEKYIRSAIESVLNQTVRDLKLIIRDNGTTDNTKYILNEYAKKDDRVIVYRNEKNNVVTEEEHKLQEDIFKNHVIECGAEYFVSIDSDDYYELDFLQKSYEIAKKNDADIVVYGNSFIDENTEEILGSRVPKKIVVKNKQMDEEDFPHIYDTIRPLWAKLYSCKWWNRYFQIIEEEMPKELKNGGDTFTMLTLLKEMDNIHFIDEVMYHYRVRKTSWFNSNLDTLRIKQGYILFRQAYIFLEQWGILTPMNVSFLLSVYRGHVGELTKIVLESQNVTLENKLKYIKSIMQDEHYINFSNSNKILLDDIYVALTVLAETNSDDIDTFINILNSDVTSNEKELFDLAAICVQQNKLDVAKEALLALQRKMTLNRNVIYLRIVVDVKKNDIQSIILYCEIGKLFFGNDKELMELINSIQFK